MEGRIQRVPMQASGGRNGIWKKLPSEGVKDMKKKWNGHSTSCQLEMLQSGELVDFVIEVHQVQLQQPQSDQQKGGSSSNIGQAHTDAVQIQKTEFNVHKFILSANSVVFRAMFGHKESKEYRESRMVITDSTIAAVRHMIHYMYTGTLPEDFHRNEDETAVLPLLAIAHKYQINPLMEYNGQLLYSNATMENVFDRLKLAELYQLNSLKSDCAEMIRLNIDEEEMKQMPEWIELEKIGFFQKISGFRRRPQLTTVNMAINPASTL